MTISYQMGDADAQGATARSTATCGATPEAMTDRLLSDMSATAWPPYVVNKISELNYAISPDHCA